MNLKDRNIVITGGTSGIGREVVRRLHRHNRVLVIARSAERLEALTEAFPGVETVHADLAQRADVERAAVAVSDRLGRVDLLINNAGVYGPRTGFGETDYEEWLDVLQVNTLAPLRMVERFVGLLEKSQGKTVVNISSVMGSVGNNSSGGSYIYRSSKAALNMVTKTLSNDLGEQGFTVVSFHPGWVQTDMGGEEADITPLDSVAGMRKVIAGLTTADNGKFYSYDGTALPW